MGDYLDVDWTLKQDWTEELRLREVRNELAKTQLQAGKTVAYRSSGWSLFPKVCSNDLCIYVPVNFDDQVQERDIVFCQVQPSGFFYAHLVLWKEWHYDAHAWKYWVSNLKQRINGYCFVKGMYGKLSQVLK